MSLQALGRAIEANIVDQVRLLSASSPHIQIHDESDMVWITTDVPHSYLNRVYQAHLNQGEVDRKISDTLSYFTGRGRPLSWHVGPASSPTHLEEHLKAHGLLLSGDEVGMAVDLLNLDEEIALPSDLVIDRVDCMPKLQHWMSVVAVSFQYPEDVAQVLVHAFGQGGFREHLPWRQYVAYLHGDPMGASRLFLGAGVAGLYALATVLKKRRKGIGTAMALVPLGEARRLGYRIGVLRGAEMVLGIYRRLGFREFCRFGIY